MEIKSGVILEDVKPEDFLFGKLGDNEVKCPTGNWTPYLPKNEKQRQGFESMCCTNFSSTTAVEILMTRLIEENLISKDNLDWLKDNGYIDETGHINFSDRFDAIVSNTNPDYGNTLKAPAEAKHKYGLIPEKLLPWTDNKTDYFNRAKITPEMFALGLEFLKHFQINYEFVYPAQYSEALKVSPLAGACFAWPNPINGIYPRSTNQINHAIAIIKPPEIWNIMDSYEEFTKRLSNNYIFSGHSIRYVITEVKTNDMIVDESLLIKLYRLIFHRPLDAGATAHIGVEIDDLLSTLEKSGEWKFIDGVVKFIKLLKAPLQVFGKIFGKHNKLTNKNMERQLGQWWNSAADAEKLSTTIKGFFSLGVITAIVAILKLIGVNIGVDNFNELLDNIGGVIVAIAGAISALISLYGLIRRIFFKTAGLGAYKK